MNVGSLDIILCIGLGLTVAVNYFCRKRLANLRAQLDAARTDHEALSRDAKELLSRYDLEQSKSEDLNARLVESIRTLKSIEYEKKEILSRFERVNADNLDTKKKYDSINTDMQQMAAELVGSKDAILKSRNLQMLELQALRTELERTKNLFERSNSELTRSMSEVELLKSQLDTEKTMRDWSGQKLKMENESLHEKIRLLDLELIEQHRRFRAQMLELQAGS